MSSEVLLEPGLTARTKADVQSDPSERTGMLLGLALATWMEFYTYDGVNLVLPDMAGTFGVSQDQASWVQTTYISALLFGVPLSIWMAGHFGYRRYIIGSTIIFAASSIGCSFAVDLQMLLFWRAIQGFAGAGLTMWWRAGVYMTMTGPQRSGSLMRISVVLYLATAVGLIFCGYVTDTFGWRLIFLPNVLFAAAAVRLLLDHFPNLPQPTDARAVGVDRLGILLLGIALISIQIVLSRGNIDGWFGSSEIQLVALIGVISLISFVIWQLDDRNLSPLLQLKLVRDRNVQAAISLGLFGGMILSGSIYALPEFLRNVYPHQLSATQTGRIMCVYALTAACIRPLVTKSVAKFGQRKVMIFAFAMLVASMLLFARLMTTGTTATAFAVPLVFYAFCLAPMLSAISSGTVGRLPRQNQLDGVAIYMTVRQFGAALGITAVTTLLDRRETLHSSRLLEHLHAGNIQMQVWIDTAARAIIQRGGYSSFQAHQMALKQLSDVADRQAATLAYADAFLFMAGIGVMALCFVPLIARPEAVKR
jgi:MFS transporter, DHA2 family, multidrug resistance protein